MPLRLPILIKVLPQPGEVAIRLRSIISIREMKQLVAAAMPHPYIIATIMIPLRQTAVFPQVTISIMEMQRQEEVAIVRQSFIVIQEVQQQEEAAMDNLYIIATVVVHQQEGDVIKHPCTTDIQEIHRQEAAVIRCQNIICIRSRTAVIVWFITPIQIVAMRKWNVRQNM